MQDANSSGDAAATKRPTVGEIVKVLDSWAPPSLQEEYDNSGLLVGERDRPVGKVLVALDCTEAVVEEALRVGAQLIIAHHPIVFTGLKRFTGANYVERTVMSAIKNDIAIFAIHTNLDNVKTGVNKMFATAVGCLPETLEILRPKRNRLLSLAILVPSAGADVLRDALFEAGAGEVGNYSQCSFSMEGTGTFKPSSEASPVVGEANGPRETTAEERVEVLVSRERVSGVLAAMKAAHPYEEVAHFLTPLENVDQGIGSGMVGDLSTPVSSDKFLNDVKKALGAEVIRHTALVKDQVQRVAVCGGSGSFLLNDAIAAGADIFITSDFKYHEFFDAENHLIVADVGHYESEWGTIKWVADHLIAQFNEKFPNFAVRLAETRTNPVHYR